jgi:hypothetical protein
VRDSGGTSNGGADTDPTPNTVTVDVTPVNDAPTFVKGLDQVALANAGAANSPKAYSIDPWATAISAGPGEAGQTLTFEVTSTNAILFTVQPAVAAGGGLSFTTDPDQVGTSTVTVRLKDNGGTADGGDASSDDQTFTISTVEPGPAITSISPTPLVPGGPAILTGREFSPTPANNTVTIGGVNAPVTAATATSLTVTVPCVSSGSGVAVKATVSGTDTNTLNHALQVTQRDLAVGEAAIIDDASQVGCNEITSAGGAARYVIAAYNTSTSPAANAPIQLSSDPSDGAAVSSASDDEPVAGLVEERGDLESPESGEAHLRLLKGNREQYKLLRDEFGTAGVQPSAVQQVATDLPLTRNFRVANVNVGNFCNNYYVGSATRVYAEGKLVIYEDDATPAALKAAGNPAMAGYYDKIGDQFNADMEPIIRNNFGDILRRDAVTDNNGVMVAISTPRINTSFPGVAGFVVSCDQFPNDDPTVRAVGGPYAGPGVNGASNFGEYFYLYQPTDATPGYGTSATADSWYRTVRSTFIHESKHVASMAARTANGAPLEVAWLEEGTARHAEELWARTSIYNVAWKGNTGYGSAASPNSIYCDLRPSDATCTATNPRRPSLNMYRHFSSMYTYLASSNSALLSPFGATSFDSASYWYATSWSLVRYAIDRYGTSDAAFLKGLIDSSSTGVTNLAQQTGVSTEQLLGRWALALSVDDYPGMTGASPDVKMPTWNFRDIYAGFLQDGQTTAAYPSVPDNYSFGTFTTPNVSNLRGGGVKLFQVSGTQTQPQLLRLLGSSGAALPSTVRLSIVRVQ